MLSARACVRATCLTIAVALLGVVVFLATACGGEERGSGTLITVVREAETFNELRVSGTLKVEVSVVDGAAPAAAVTIDDNLVSKVRIRFSDNRLRVETTEEIRPSEESVIRLVTPSLEEIRAEAGARVAVSGVEGSSLRIEASSGAAVEAEGGTERVDVDASSGASVDLSGLSAEEADVDASSGAAIEVQASKSVSGAADSGAVVRISGNPERVDVDIDSGARVE